MEFLRRLEERALRMPILIWASLVLLVSPLTFLDASASQTDLLTAATGQETSKDMTERLPGSRIIVGTVEEVSGDQIKVNTGEVQPRFLSLKVAIDKGFPAFKQGDRLEILVNDQNLVVDYHPLSAGGHHRILNGQIATPLVVGHERAVIRSVEGKEESFEIQPLARSKMASIPVGINAMFLIDETNKIADASFGNTEAVSKAMDAWMKKSPLKGSYQRLEGTLAKSSENRITINTQEGREQSFAVDPSVGGKLKGLQPGEHVTLFLDANQKILDLSTPQHTGK